MNRILSALCLAIASIASAAPPVCDRGADGCAIGSVYRDDPEAVSFCEQDPGHGPAYENEINWFDTYNPCAAPTYLDPECKARKRKDFMDLLNLVDKAFRQSYCKCHADHPSDPAALQECLAGLTSPYNDELQEIRTLMQAALANCACVSDARPIK